MRTQVLRPSRQRYWRWLASLRRRALVLVLALVVINVTRADTIGEALFFLALVGGAVVAVLGCTLVLIGTSRVTIGGGRVDYRRWWVRRTVLDGDDVVGVLAPFHASAVNVREASRLLVLRARDGGPRIRLNGVFWTTEQLEAIAAEVGVEATDETLTTQGFEAEVRHIMYWRERHWVAFGTVAGLVLVALVTVIVIGWWSHQGRPPFDDRPPRGVPAATVSEQDELVADIVAAVDAPWGESRVELTACEDDDDHKGWQRDVRVEVMTTDDPETGEVLPVAVPPLDDSLSRQLTSLFARQGYGSVSRDDDGELRGMPERAFTNDDLRSVRVRLDDRFTEIDVRGRCETPGR